MRKWISFLIFASACSSCSSQKDKRSSYSLLTWEYKTEGNGKVPSPSKLVLAKYQWNDSDYTRTELFQSEYRLPNYSLYATTLHDNRYLINILGDVLDLQSNTIIHEHIGFDPFITKQGNRLYFRHTKYKPNPPFHSDTLRHAAIRSAFYYFDLGTKKITGLDSLPMADMAGPDYPDFPNSLLSLPVEFSPDKKKIVYFVSDKNILMDSSRFLCGWTRIYPSYGSLYVKRMGNDSLKIADSVLFETSIRMANYLPVVWLNDDELITQKKNGQVIKINISTGKTAFFAPITGVVDCSFPTRFHKTDAGDIFYYCQTKNGDLHRVNTDSQTIQLSPQLPLSNGYSYEIWGGHPNAEYVKAYYYNGTRITTDTTTTLYNKISPNGLIAIRCIDVEKPTPYLFREEPVSGMIRVIDPVKKEEIKIKVGLLPQLIGWLKE